jgi:hypothetical protein
VFIVLGEGNTDTRRDQAVAEGALHVLVRGLLSEALARDVSEWEIGGDRLPRLHRGHGFREKVRLAIANHSRDQSIEFMAIAIDRDGPRNARRLRLLEDGRSDAQDQGHRLASKTAVGVMIEMLEAWLLADTGALARVLGTSGARPDPETIPEPKSTLSALIGNANIAVSDAYDRLAEAADIRVISQRCSAFERFAHEVRHRATAAPA